ncbi:cytochrome b/b6 domain-containing protein [Cribrihabitans pelagius]|uniref:cytochrome b/b6 domain-containing protein n=1 Tax=Cribrihabitans pelagius TaxID=1765746 RepID=UPI003B5AC452
MSRANTPSSYGSVAKGFHWLTALLIFTVLPLGYFAKELAVAIQGPGFDGSEAVIERATLLFSLHKTLGVTIFFTALLRILWALSQPKPGLLHPGRKAEALAAETVHWLLYGSLVLVPLSGWVHHAATTGFAPIWWPFGQRLPFVPLSEPLAHTAATLHWLLVWTLAAALTLHIAGALKHHVIDRDATLRRMLPGRAALPRPPEQGHSLAPLAVALAVWAAVLAGGAGFGLFSTPSATGTAAPVVASGQPAREDANWRIEQGRLGLEVTQMGSSVTGSFKDWSARIRFDEPAAPGPAGNVEVTVAIPSLELGSVTAQAMGADYFDAASHPTAIFKAGILKLEEGYQAEGTLEIKGQPVPVILPFTLELEGERARMQGAMDLNRLDFGIGAGLKDESSLAFAVTVSVELEATRAQ